MLVSGMRLYATKVEDTDVTCWEWFDESLSIGWTQPVEGGYHFQTSDRRHTGVRRTRKEALLVLVEYAKCSPAERKELRKKMPKRGSAEERPADFKRGY